MVLPLLVALGLGAASLAGAGIQASGAKNAAAVQRKTALENREMATEFTDASLADLDAALAGAMEQREPFKQAGETALSEIMGLLGLKGPEGSSEALSNFTTSPSYNFRVGEGVKALDRSANARGDLYSGAQGKALTAYGQEMGSLEFDNQYRRLSDLAGTGENIANANASALLGTGQNKAATRSSGLSAITGANAQAGAATAGGITGAANAWNSGLSNLTQVAGSYFGGQPSSLSQIPAGGIY